MEILIAKLKKGRILVICKKKKRKKTTMYFVFQVTKIYFSYIFGLYPQFWAHSSPNPWNVLVIRAIKVSFCSVNEVTLGPHLKMGGGCQENQPCDWKVATFSSTPSHLWGGARVWRLNQSSRPMIYSMLV